MYQFNPEQTKKLQSKPVYAQYKKWLEKNKVKIHPSVIYPAYFGEKGQGIIGVASSKSIPKNQAIVAVPYSLLITIDKVKENQQLFKIMKQNPNMFRVSKEAVSYILILFICYEMTKKGQSFYGPYFAISTDIFLDNWNQLDKVALQNNQISKLIRKQRDILQECFMNFLRIFRHYPNVFSPEMSNSQYKKLYQTAHTFVMTRAFGWSLPSVSLIPMADSFNHHNTFIQHFLVDIQQQLKPHPSYIPHHKKVDLSLLQQPSLKLQEKDLILLRKEKKTRKQKFINRHKQILKNQKVKDQHMHILHQQYKAQIRNIRQLHFYEESCSEDNDTDEQIYEDFTVKSEKFKFYEKYERRNIEQKFKKYELTQYWKMHLQEDEESDEEKENKPKVNKEEAKKFLQDEGKESQGSSNVSSTDSDDDDEEFDWINQQQSNKTTYFVMSTKDKVQQNEQICTFYGRRSNKFLLTGYNFVLEQNKYDSFSFKLNIDWEFSKLSISKLIYKGNSQYHTKQIRLKYQHINNDLINHCRALFIGWNKLQEFKNVRITIPFNLDVEKKVLALAADFIKHFLKQYNSTIEEDQQLLEKCRKHETTTAILMRMNYKKILQQQLRLVGKCQDFLKLWKGGRLDVKQKDMQLLGRVKEYFCGLERAKI